MFTGGMFMIGLFVASPTDFGISRRIPSQDGLMVRAMTAGAINRRKVSAGLPLVNRSGSLFLVTLDTIFCCDCHSKQQYKQQQYSQSQTTTHF
jgi:hypothetical protein